MDRTCSAHRKEEERTQDFFVENPEGRIPLGSHRCKWEAFF
jgi:hypothetical protein